MTERHVALVTRVARWPLLDRSSVIDATDEVFRSVTSVTAATRVEECYRAPKAVLLVGGASLSGDQLLEEATAKLRGSETKAVHYHTIRKINRGPT